MILYVTLEYWPLNDLECDTGVLTFKWPWMWHWCIDLQMTLHVTLEYWPSNDWLWHWSIHLLITLNVTLEYWPLNNLECDTGGFSFKWPWLWHWSIRIWFFCFVSPVFCWNFGITKFTHIVEKHFKAFFM